MKTKKPIPINRHTKEYIRDLLTEKDFTDSDSYALFIHVFVCSFIPSYSDDDDSETSFDFRFVPLPYDWLSENASEADWRSMVSKGLLTFKEHQAPIGKKVGLCREFAIPESLMSEILDKDEYDMNNNNLVSSVGKDDFRAYKAANNLYDENRNKLPSLIIQSMTSIKPLPFNPHALKKYLESVDRSHSDHFHGKMMLKRQVEAYHLPAYSTNPEDGYTSYSSEYEAKKTGRIFEAYGLQGASRVMRAVALSGVPDIYNYDLKASQALGLLHQFNMAGIKCQWLDDYCFEPGFQERIRGELPKSLWKVLLYCTFFGGRVSPKLSDMRFYDEQNQKETYLSAAKAVMRYARENNLTAGQVDDALAHFCQAIEPLREALAAWKTYLITDYLAERDPVTKKLVHVTGKSKRFIVNPCGMSLRIDELEKVPGKAKLKAAIAAHQLQGYESAYIHHLTALSSSYGFKVVNNQHDGLICLGNEIPKEAHEKAKELSGLSLAELEIKPLG